MKLKIGDHTVELLGDPHAGRKFETGVPLHRRGEREQLQMMKFRDNLLNTDVDIHINMGDTFDKFIVAPEVVLAVASYYFSAAEKNPNTLYIILQGNHDVSRNKDKASSFDLLSALVYSHPNIWAIDAEPVVYDGLLLVPFNMFGYGDLENYITPDVKAVFGHFDVVDFGGLNVVPTELFAKHGISHVYTGHDHVARVERRHNVEITVTGSMEPFTHAEDPEGKAYVTLTLAELAGRDVTNMNVRILLADGETLPTDIDCLSLTAKRVSSDEIVTVDTTTFDAIDLGDMLASALGGLAVKDLILGFYHDHKTVS